MAASSGIVMRLDEESLKALESFVDAVARIEATHGMLETLKNLETVNELIRCGGVAKPKGE